MRAVTDTRSSRYFATTEACMLMPWTWPARYVKYLLPRTQAPTSTNKSVQTYLHYAARSVTGADTLPHLLRLYPDLEFVCVGSVPHALKHLHRLMPTTHPNCQREGSESAHVLAYRSQISQLFSYETVRAIAVVCTRRPHTNLALLRRDAFAQIVTGKNEA